MSPAHLRDLLTACPELTVDDIKRLISYRPKRSLMFVAIQAVIFELSMA